MPEIPTSQILKQQLSVGNVINVTLNLYRANFKLYLKLSCFAYLWLFVPLYGWAKFLAISALISRLAFSELMGQTESIKDARRYIRPRTWSFLALAIFLFVLLFVVLMISFVLTGLLLLVTRFEQVIAPLEVVSDEGFVRGNILMATLFLILLLLILFFLLACMFVPTLWLYSRFFITELPLASEPNINLIKTLCRSWKLTKGYFWRIQIILIVAMFLLLPIELLLYLLGEAINVISSKVMPNLLSSYPRVDSILVDIFSLGIAILNAVMLMPFLQVIKAVVYYNLRLRREGLGLNLRDHALSND
jgi:hypothetical protein